MYIKTGPLACAILAVPLIAAQGDGDIPQKTAFNLKVDVDEFGVIEPALIAKLPLQSFTTDNWGAGWIPEDCLNQAKSLGHNPVDMQIFNVHYSDCSEPWIMCLHKDVATHKNLMIDRIGRVPLQMREFIRHFSHYPGGLNGAAAFNQGDNIAVGGDSMQMVILTHEISHSMDSHARLDIVPGQFSLGQIWQDNYNLDSKAISLASWSEDFAETGIVALFDRVADGGLGSITNDWNSIFHQYATYQGYMGEFIPPAKREKCTQRLANSPPVPNGASARLDKSTKPDVSFKGDIKIIPPANTTCQGIPLK